jgi:hypothetical protein
VTGLIFSVLVTRNLLIEEFGLYSLIGSLVAYAMFGHIILSYWTSRHIARGEDAGKTSLVTSGIFSGLGTIMYLAVAIFVASNTKTDFSILLLGSLIIPLTYVSNTLDNINQGFRPQATSYSLVSFELAKVPLGFLLLQSINMGIEGAMLATIFALGVKCIVGIYFAYPKLSSKFNPAYIKKWLKLSWLSLYDGVSSNIYVLDTLIVSLILSSTEPLAYFAAAMTVSTIAAHSTVLSFALAPKLISDANIEHVKTVLRLFSLIGIPIFVAVIIFAKPILFLLNPAYSVAVIAVYLMASRAFIYSIYTLFAGVLGGMERVDTINEAKFTHYRKSNLFYLSTLHYIRAGVYIGSLLVLTFIAKIQFWQTIDIVIAWGAASLLGEILIVIPVINKVKKIGFLSFEFKFIIKYSLIALIVAIMSLLMIDRLVVFERNLATFLPGLFTSLAFGVVLYFGILYFLDDYTKRLFKAILHR